MQTELESAVGEVLIETDALRGRIADDSTGGGDYPNAIVGRADMRGAPDAIPEEEGRRRTHGFPGESEPKAKRNAD